MSTIFPTTVPTKRLQTSITSSASAFSLSDILGWDGVALTSASLGTVAYVVFRNAANTQIEIMEIDPSTVASAAITINKRGLDYTGDLTTQSASRKFSWTKGTYVELGTHVPQLLKHFVTDIGDQSIAGIKTFTSLPTIPLTPSASTDAASKGYADGLAIAGAPNASTTVKGIVEEATQAELRARTAAGGTGAELYVNPTTLPNVLIADYIVDTGSANAYAIAPSPAVVAYVTGQRFTFKAVNANTGASTVNVNGLGTKNIFFKGAALTGGEIAASQMVEVEYDGTQFQMMSPATNVNNVVQTYTPSAAGTATLDLTKGGVHHITMPAGNITIAITGGVAGQFFYVRILQDGTGSRTVTWFVTIKWPGGTPPTLTTTASKIDSFGFEVTTAGSAYDGVVVAQNL